MLRIQARRLEAFSLLGSSHLVQAAEAGAAAWGLYGVGNEKGDENWRTFTKSLKDQIDPSKTSIDTVNSVLSILGRNNVSIGTFWSSVFEEKLDQKIQIEKLKIHELTQLVQACNSVDYRSETAIGKLVSLMIANESLWTVSPAELVEVATTVANSLTQNRPLFSDIGNRLESEIDDFGNDEIISIIEAFAKVNFTHQEMLKVVLRKFVDEPLSVKDKIRVADAISRLRFRSDTFFKSLCKDELAVDQAASVCVAMQRLKMNTGRTEWWDRETDFASLLGTVRSKFLPDVIETMNARQIANCVQLVRHNGMLRVSNAVFDRLQHLLTQDPLSRSYRFIAVIFESLGRGSETGAVHVDHLRWMAEWLCGNVYILPVHDIAVINRAIAKLGFRDHNYHKIWIPYYLERIQQLTKEDVSTISDNFNDIGMSDTQMGGRHFFYKLGKRFQELSVDSNGEKDMTERRKYRNIQRLG